jgi:hypothetical protein
LSDSDSTERNDNIEISTICYAKGTQILCLINNQEKYVKIENLNKNNLVKTYKNGYQKIVGIVKGKNIKSLFNEKNCIYKLKKHTISLNTPFEDLYVTGAHSILVDDIDEKLIDKLSEIHGGLDKIKIEDKYKLLVSMCDLFEIVDTDKSTTIYQIALENINNYDHYGIYANGILSESMNIYNYETDCNCKLDYKNIKI